MKEVEIVRMHDGKIEKQRDIIVRERILNIFVDGELFDSVSYSSGFTKELLFGYLYLETIINDVQDVIKYSLVDNDYSTNAYVEVKKSPLPEIINELIKVERGTFFVLMKELLLKGEIFAKTGGTHIAGIATENKLDGCFEDMSRRSAIQKCVGFALLNRLKPNFLLSSGRIGFNTVLYSKRACIQFIVSQSSVSDLAVQTAFDANITLIGFLRGHRFNVYSHSEYII